MVTSSISRNSLFNLLGAIIPLGVAAMSVPYLLPRLGDERFGILTLLWAIIGFFSMFDLGLGRAVTQQIATHLGMGSSDKIRGVINVGVLLTAVTGFLGGCLLASLAGKLARSGLGVSVGLAPETEKCLLAASIGVPLATISAGLRGVLEGYSHFFAVNMAKIVFGVAIFALPALSVSVFGPNLFNVTISLVLARLIAMLAFWALTFNLAYRQEKIVKLHYRSAWKILAFGLWMGVSNLVSPILIYADRFAIATLLGASQVAFYTVPFEFIVRTLIIPGALGASLLPRLSAEFVVSYRDARKLLKASFVLTFSVMLALTVSAAFLARPLMTWLLGAEFTSNSASIAVVLCAGVFFNGVANIPYTALHSLGAAKQTGILHLTELVLYLPTLYFFIANFGVIGAAIAWSLRTLVDAAALFGLLSLELRRLEIRSRDQ